MSRMANRCQEGDDKVNFLKRILLFIAISISAFGFRLQGITFNKSLENGYKEYKVYNDTLKKTRYKIQILPAGDVDVTKSIEVFPKIITIEPQGEGIFKLFGNGKQKLEDKEYEFIMKFDGILIPTLSKGKDGEVSGSAAVGIAPSITMKGYGGVIDYSKALDLQDITFEKNKEGKLLLKGRLVNNSHGAIELAVRINDKSRKKSSSEAIGGIEANTTKELEIELESFSDGDQVKYIEFYDDEFKVVKQIER